MRWHFSNCPVSRTDNFERSNDLDTTLWYGMVWYGMVWYGMVLSYLIVILTNINKLMINVRRMLKNNFKNKITIKDF